MLSNQFHHLHYLFDLFYNHNFPSCLINSVALKFKLVQPLFIEGPLYSMHAILGIWNVIAKKII